MSWNEDYAILADFSSFTQLRCHLTSTSMAASSNGRFAPGSSSKSRRIYRRWSLVRCHDQENQRGDPEKISRYEQNTYAESGQIGRHQQHDERSCKGCQTGRLTSVPQ